MKMLETLESRRLFAITVYQVADWLNVDGSNGNDHITIEDSNGNGPLRVRDNGVSVGTYSGVTHVRVRAFGGRDHLFVTSNQTQIQYLIEMGDGNDHVEPGQGNHFITGGPGIDSVSYAKFGLDMYITNKDGNWTGYRTTYGVTQEDKIGADVEAMFGGSGDDVIIGNNNANQLYGGPGNDFLFGNGGADYLSGHEGNDFIWGHEGHDTLHGGLGNDYLVGGLGNDTIYSRDGWGIDTVIGDNVWGVNAPGTFDRVYGDTIDALSGHEWAELTPPPIFPPF